MSLIARKNSIPANQVYLIHDELDMMTGAYGMRDGGSARGHNGVKSVINCLQSKVRMSHLTQISVILLSIIIFCSEFNFGLTYVSEINKKVYKSVSYQ